MCDPCRGFGSSCLILKTYTKEEYETLGQLGRSILKKKNGGSGGGAGGGGGGLWGLMPLARRLAGRVASLSMLSLFFSL